MARSRRRILLRVFFFQPEGFELIIADPVQKQPIAKLYHDEIPIAESKVEAAGDLIFELALPFHSLAVGTDDPIQFCIELIKDEESIERVPHEGAIETSVPSPDYELIMWQA